MAGEALLPQARAALPHLPAEKALTQTCWGCPVNPAPVPLCKDKGAAVRLFGSGQVAPAQGIRGSWGHSPKSLHCHAPPGLWGGMAVLGGGDSACGGLGTVLEHMWPWGSTQAGAAQQCAQNGVFLCPSTGTVG